MYKIVIVALLFAFVMIAQSGLAEMPETQRSQKAEARFSVPLKEALNKKGLSLGAPIFLRITKTQSK